MNSDNRFSRLSLVAFFGLAGFVAGALLLWLDSSLTGMLPLPFGDAWVHLPMLMGGDLIFLLVWFAFWVAIGILVGIWVTHHKVHALSPALLSERTKLHRKKSFTLIELLIVIAIIAVLATVVILALNPAQMLMRARDANRASDMKTLNQALTLYSEDVGGDMGASSTLYISVPDPDATTSLGDACEGLGLSTSSLPSGWTYHCAGPDYYKNVDGTGWIPVDFKSESFGSSIGTLPVDPINQTSSGLYYTYAANGDPWELTALFESDKYATLMANDGGTDPAMYEVGTDLALTPFVHGLVGWWKLDEGSGDIAYDSSGFGDNGTWSGTATGTSGYYSPGHNQAWAGAFDGTSTYITTPSSIDFHTPDRSTLTAWVNSNMDTTCSSRYQETGVAVASTEEIPDIAESDHSYGGSYPSPCDVFVSSAVIGGGGGGTGTNLNSFTLSDGTWYFVAATYNGTVQSLYINGVLQGSETRSGGITYGPGTIVIGGGPNNFYKGEISDVRAYNRALSASEIQAIYNAEK